MYSSQKLYPVRSATWLSLVNYEVCWPVGSLPTGRVPQQLSMSPFKYLNQWPIDICKCQGVVLICHDTLPRLAFVQSVLAYGSGFNRSCHKIPWGCPWVITLENPKHASPNKRVPGYPPGTRRVLVSGYPGSKMCTRNSSTARAYLSLILLLVLILLSQASAWFAMLSHGFNLHSNFKFSAFLRRPQELR